MNNTARKVIPILPDSASNGAPAVKIGSVLSMESGKICVNMAGDIKHAQKAFSCIIDPRPDDVVICSEDVDGQVYLLGVIARPGDQKASISFPSDTCIRTDRGGLSLNSDDHVSITSKQMNCFSQKAIHKSHEAVISYDKVIASGDELQAGFKTVRLISNLINTMAKQVIDKFKGYIRQTENNDMVKSGQMTRQTEGLYAMDSKHTIMNSKKSTKIDGEKILMG